MDVSGSSFRLEATLDYPIGGGSWALWARPLSIDILNANELGGPITTWQVRLGVAYRIGKRRAKAARATTPTAPQPTAPTAPAPMGAPPAPITPTAPPAPTGTP
jgi:hypothetical protein